MKSIVVGYSKSGRGAAELLSEKKYDVYIYDDNKNINTKPYKRVYKENLIECLIDTQLMVISPSISIYSKIVDTAKSMGVEVISEIELAYRYSNHDIVAVTGTNGKTTTTLLIKELLLNAGIDAHEVGNIGKAYSSELKDMTQNSIAVLEVSSFQLEGIVSFKSKYAICLNVTEDHMDRHKSINLYALCKQKLFMNQECEDIAILNYDDIIVRDYALRIRSKVYFFSTKNRVKGVYVFDDYIVSELNGFEKIMKVSEIYMKGIHNLSNVLASILFAKLIGINNEIITNTIKTFKAPAFRMEYVMDKYGKRIINDSKATNIDSTLKACKSINENICLICGGYDKGISYESFYSNLPSNVKNIIFTGDNANTMISFINSDAKFKYYLTKTLQRAVELAFNTDDDVILFSPTTSSFDRYSSYIERGEIFNKIIQDFKRG